MDKRLDACQAILAEEQARRRTQRRAGLILAVSVALGLGALAYGLKEVARSQPAPAAVDLSNLPPIRPGPQR
jgi:hypothetical protein